ncbi:hypothetical protein I4U23_025128 [Adineta vaga]|nr:hypothetical protein I4U23_025128 [Adineta vaga]
MYPGPFKPVPMSFQYPGQQQPQQAPSSLYQSAYTGYNAFVPPARERSAPASSQPNPSANGPYAATPTRRNSKHSRQPPYQHHEYCNNHDSKCKRYHRRTCMSPNGAADQSLYSDEMKTSEDLNRSPTPPSKSRLKPEETHANDHDSKVHGFKPTNNDIPQGIEESQNFHDYNKRKSRSKRRGQQRNQQPQAPSNSQKRSHQQPLFNSHYQIHEESSRRDDVYYKHSKRPSRVHHEDNHQVPLAPGDRPYSSAYAPYSPYHPSNYYQPGTHYQAQTTHAPQPNTNGVNTSFEREIQRLRSHIHALENELHNLQKKIHKTTLHHVDTSTQDDFNLKKHRTKRHGNRSPRQTPVIVEINNGHGEHARDISPKKQHNRRSSSHVNSHQGRSHHHLQHRQSSKVSERQHRVHYQKAPSQSPKPQENNPCDCACVTTNQVPEQEVKPIPIQTAKQPREDTAAQLAQLAHAAAARVQARQLVPPPPPVQHLFSHAQEVLPPQNQQLRDLNGPHPASINPPDLNLNQSNNNEIYTNVGERHNRSAEKILDAFERFYKNIGRSSTTPVKVKYIPGETNCNHCQQRGINNIPCATGNGLSPSSSTSSSSSDEVIIQECQQKTTYAYT